MPKAREDWTGIHPHNGGWKAVVSRGTSLPRLRRWFTRGTPVAIMQKWRQTEQAKWILQKNQRKTATQGRFRADMERYLNHPDVLKKPTYKERRPQLERWAAEFGDTLRDQITSAEVRKIRDRWATEPRSKEDSRPLSAGRVNRLVATLSNLYTVLDGRAAYNPVRGLAPLFESQGPVRDIPAKDLKSILANLSDRARPLKGQPWANGSKTKARIQVLAATGMPLGTLMKLRPEDVDLQKRLVYRPARLKGEGVRATPLPLTKAAVTAFREFAKLNCWGKFSRSSLYKSLGRAVKRSNIGRHVRPTDLRHTFLTQIAKATGDEVAAMNIAQHASVKTTQRYTRGSISMRARAAVDALDALAPPKKRKPKRRVY